MTHCVIINDINIYKQPKFSIIGFVTAFDVKPNVTITDIDLRWL
jgi:hypothetical protein